MRGTLLRTVFVVIGALPRSEFSERGQFFVVFGALRRGVFLALGDMFMDRNVVVRFFATQFTGTGNNQQVFLGIETRHDVSANNVN